MYDKYLSGSIFQLAQPFEKLFFIGVCRETVYPGDPGVDRILLSENSYLFLAVNDSPAECTYRLVADEHYRVLGFGDIIDQMMFDSSAGAHPRAGYNHNRAPDMINGL